MEDSSDIRDGEERGGTGGVPHETGLAEAKVPRRIIFRKKRLVYAGVDFAKEGGDATTVLGVLATSMRDAEGSLRQLGAAVSLVRDSNENVMTLLPDRSGMGPVHDPSQINRLDLTRLNSIGATLGYVRPWETEINILRGSVMELTRQLNAVRSSLTAEQEQIRNLRYQRSGLQNQVNFLRSDQFKIGERYDPNRQYENQGNWNDHSFYSTPLHFREGG